jgi:anti-sigma regulatory factor (Ser/Thr protein kinase)
VNSLSLAAVPSAVSCARLFVTNVLEQWRLTYLADMAELLTSELVTNSVKATGITDPSPRSALLGDVCLIQVQLVLMADSLFIGVWDRDERPPVLREPDLESEGGRGMLMIETMSERWGYQYSKTGGKVVWFELKLAGHTTPSGLPIRTPNTVPAGHFEVEDDMALLRRVVERLRRLQ